MCCVGSDWSPNSTDEEGNTKYAALTSIMKGLLALPHSNAEAERIVRKTEVPNFRINLEIRILSGYFKRPIQYGLSFLFLDLKNFLLLSSRPVGTSGNNKTEARAPMSRELLSDITSINMHVLSRGSVCATVSS